MKSKATDKSKYQHWIDPQKVKPYERNAKQHTDKQIKNIVNSIRRFGWQQDTVITLDNVLVIGHGRRLAAIQLGCEMPFHYVDKTADELTDEDIRELRIADNQTNAETGLDLDVLGDEIADLKFEGFDFDFKVEATVEVVEDNYDRPVPSEPKSKEGDLYCLGEHRLLCGDATILDDVEKLVDGKRVDMLLTDPPYNVDYTGGTKDALKILNDNLPDDKFRLFLSDSFKNAKLVMKPGAAFHIWHADSEGYNFRGACIDAGLKIRQCLIWEKNSLVLGRQDFQWKHEPCLFGENPPPDYGVDEYLTEDNQVALYGWCDGTHYWFKNRRQTTILKFDKPLASKEHPTMKPVLLFNYEMQCNTKPGEMVLDLFGGSGTTIIAAEQNGRKAFVMEKDPKYVDVIIDRWESFTGKKAVLLNE